MKINGEEVEQVTDRASLRIGDVVYLRHAEPEVPWPQSCPVGTFHRAMLLSFTPHWIEHYQGYSIEALGGAWAVVPLLPCRASRFAAGACEAGNVFRVISPPREAERDTRVEHPRKVVRAR